MTSPNVPDLDDLKINSVKWIPSNEKSPALFLSGSVCPNPFCSCFNLDLEIRDAPRSSSRIIAMVSLDLEKRKRRSTKDKNADHERMISEFLADLDDDDWILFFGLFSQLRQFMIKSYDYENGTYFNLDFPVEQIETESVMIGYSEVFPTDPQRITQIDGVPYIIDEQYCIQRSCPCADCVLTLIVADGSAESRKNYSYLINYKKWRIEHFPQGTVNPIAAGKVLAALSEDADNGRDAIRERHQRLRTIYRNYRRRQELEPASADPKPAKVGRNDPCPCGSGKKFKFCCGKPS